MSLPQLIMKEVGETSQSIYSFNTFELFRHIFNECSAFSIYLKVSVCSVTESISRKKVSNHCVFFPMLLRLLLEEETLRKCHRVQVLPEI